MKTSHLLVAGVIGISAISLLKSSKKLTKITDTTSSTDDDLLQWKGDPSQVSYEIPEGLVYNGETLRDFCGSFWSIRDRSPWHAELCKLGDAIRAYAEKDWKDISLSDEVRHDNVNRATEDLRVKVVEAWLRDGTTHNIILNWMNGDFDVSKLSQLDVNNLRIVAIDKTLPEGIAEFVK